jgi:hypothetical protein
MKRFVLLGVAILVLGACGRGSSGEASSGIEGRVTIGPTCPVERPDSPCPDAPFVATVRVMSGSDVAASGTSAKDGSFRIAVPPGTYSVEADPVSSGGIARGIPVSNVVVHPGAFTHVNVTFDSGIR